MGSAPTIRQVVPVLGVARAHRDPSRGLLGLVEVILVLVIEKCHALQHKEPLFPSPGSHLQTTLSPSLFVKVPQLHILPMPESRTILPDGLVTQLMQVNKDSVQYTGGGIC